MKKLQIKYLSKDEIYPNDENINIHSSKSIEKIQKSIEAFGFKNPLLIDNNNIIIAGNGRYEAGLRAGMKTFPCIVADDLNEDQLKAYGIADNRVAKDSFFDNDLLASALEELENINFDMDSLGFDEEELNFESIKEDIEKEGIVKPDEEITQELLESHNYLVFYFDNSVDFLSACQKFNVKDKTALFKHQKGLGRVLNGREILKDED